MKHNEVQYLTSVQKMNIAAPGTRGIGAFFTVGMDVAE